GAAAGGGGYAGGTVLVGGGRSGPKQAALCPRRASGSPAVPAASRLTAAAGVGEHGGRVSPSGSRGHAPNRLLTGWRAARGAVSRLRHAEGGRRRNGVEHRRDVATHGGWIQRQEAGPSLSERADSPRGNFTGATTATATRYAEAIASPFPINHTISTGFRQTGIWRVEHSSSFTSSTATRSGKQVFPMRTMRDARKGSKTEALKSVPASA